MVFLTIVLFELTLSCVRIIIIIIIAVIVGRGALRRDMRLYVGVSRCGYTVFFFILVTSARTRM